MTPFKEKVLACFDLMSQGDMIDFYVQMDNEKSYYEVDCDYSIEDGEIFRYDMITEEQIF